MNPLITLNNVYKSYTQGDDRRPVLRGITAEFEQGEMAAIRGRSGSGKTTLLNLLSGLDQPTSGLIRLSGSDFSTLSDHERTEIRRENIGIVFQFFNLIPTLTVLENVTLPAELIGSAYQVAERNAVELLAQVGLEDRKNEFIDRLSGGEQQRVAIARALVKNPEFILADEPTGNLDRATGMKVMDLLIRLSRGFGKTLIVVTHSREVAGLADRVLRIEEGLFADSKADRARRIEPEIVKS